MSASPSHPFGARSAQDLADLTAGHPLAWLCSPGPDGLMATPLPLLRHLGPAGELLALEGHFAAHNPQVAALRAQPEALVLWLGVQGYVSPSWLTDRSQAPSWNYASAQCRVRVRFDDEAATGGADAAITAHLRRLVAEHEAGRPAAWAVDEMGPRLAQLSRRVLGFRAEVLGLQQRYKLGQDERDDVFAEQLAALDAAGSAPETALAAWMRRFNPGRGPAATVIDPSDGAMPGGAA